MELTVRGDGAGMLVGRHLLGIKAARWRHVLGVDWVYLCLDVGEGACGGVGSGGGVRDLCGLDLAWQGVGGVFKLCV